jgi:hypothetical protein
LLDMRLDVTRSKLMGAVNSEIAHLGDRGIRDLARTKRSTRTHREGATGRMAEVLSVYERKRKKSPAWEKYLSDRRKAQDIRKAMGENAPGESTIRKYLRTARKEGLLRRNT